MNRTKIRQLLQEIFQAFAPFAVYAYGTGNETHLIDEIDVTASNERIDQ